MERCNGDRQSFICLLDLTGRSLREINLLTSTSPQSLFLLLFNLPSIICYFPPLFFSFLFPLVFPITFVKHHVAYVFLACLFTALCFLSCSSAFLPSALELTDTLTTDASTSVELFSEMLILFSTVQLLPVLNPNLQLLSETIATQLFYTFQLLLANMLN